MFHGALIPSWKLIKLLPDSKYPKNQISLNKPFNPKTSIISAQFLDSASNLSPLINYSFSSLQQAFKKFFFWKSFSSTSFRTNLLNSCIILNLSTLPSFHTQNIFATSFFDLQSMRDAVTKNLTKISSIYSLHKCTLLKIKFLSISKIRNNKVYIPFLSFFSFPADNIHICKP